MPTTRTARGAACATSPWKDPAVRAEPVFSCQRRQFTGTPAFQWVRPSGAVYFEFQYGATSDPGSFEYNSGLTSRNTHTPPPLQTNTEYYWYVKARDKGRQLERLERSPHDHHPAAHTRQAGIERAGQRYERQ